MNLSAKRTTRIRLDKEMRSAAVADHFHITWSGPFRWSVYSEQTHTWGQETREWIISSMRTGYRESRPFSAICIRQEWQHFLTESPNEEYYNVDVKKSGNLFHGQWLQGTSKRLFPGWEDMWWKNCVFLPAEGKQNTTFLPGFTQPGKSLIEVPCNNIHRNRQSPTSLTSWIILE